MLKFHTTLPMKKVLDIISSHPYSEILLWRPLVESLSLKVFPGQNLLSVT